MPLWCQENKIYESVVSVLTWKVCFPVWGLKLFFPGFIFCRKKLLRDSWLFRNRCSVCSNKSFPFLAGQIHFPLKDWNSTDSKSHFCKMFQIKVLCELLSPKVGDEEEDISESYAGKHMTWHGSWGHLSICITRHGSKVPFLAYLQVFCWIQVSSCLDNCNLFAQEENCFGSRISLWGKKLWRTMCLLCCNLL